KAVSKATSSNAWAMYGERGIIDAHFEFNEGVGISMAILVTGGAGYIGSVMVEILREQDHQVVVLDNLCRGHRAAVDRSVPFYEGNIGDRSLVSRICREHKIDACIHFAALAYVGESVREPRMYFVNNVENGIALLDALLDTGVKRF